MNATGFGAANGKIILMGEHAVVYGEPAIALPFSAVQLSAEVTASQAWQIDSVYHQGLLADAPHHLENIKQLVQELAAAWHLTPLTIKITSTIPPERGMGSSAATAVAVTRALADAVGHALTTTELQKWVAIAEKIAHGNPSGIDAAATSGLNPIYFIKGEPLTAFPMNLSHGILVVADTGIKGQTRGAVKDVAHLFETTKKATAQAITTLGHLAKASREAILADDLDALGATMDQAQTLLKQLTVSNQSLDELVATAKVQGALGAKLTGGGRGGCMIALAPDQQTADKIQQALATKAAATWQFNLGGDTHEG
ncbi:mevalonate kinase [Enterococcus canis]|uniref:Mevalonate kinase n=1 Tax=Enterococcus canis TaxID=214095 RepID=A0A1L8RF47_9ENTE|nr:mevalonate kinase [Enterococcus canis]OJG18353.1 mevalonate kinase [Enterococcus canis]